MPAGPARVECGGRRGPSSSLHTACGCSAPSLTCWPAAERAADGVGCALRLAPRSTAGSGTLLALRGSKFTLRWMTSCVGRLPGPPGSLLTTPLPPPHARARAGKSTLLKLMVGELEPTSGTVGRHSHLTIGRYHQHSTEVLDPTKTVLEYFQVCAACVRACAHSACLRGVHRACVCACARVHALLCLWPAWVGPPL